MKYNDLDGNGANDGEPGMEGWTIQLSKDGSLSIAPRPERTDLTNSRT